MSDFPRVHTAGWMLKVRRRPRVRASGGYSYWPGFPEVIEVQFGGHHEGDDGRVLLEIVGDEAALELASKLIAAVNAAKEGGR